MLHLLRVEMVINSPWMMSKNWLVQKQMAFGKYISNPFMADNLPKIVWFSTHHVTFMKSWLVQKQTALGQMTTGKENSNPFMADDVTRLQALVDRKKIVISEDVIHEILQLDDAEGVVYLPNEEIFAGLAQMGYEKLFTKLTFYKAFFSSQWKFLIHTLLQSLSAKRTSWNEFSTTMASANQVGDLSTHTTRFISLALTQKVFANMRLVGKGFSGVETPLFEGMLAARQLAEEGIAEEQVQADAAIAATIQENVAEIIKLKARVKRLERANKGRMIDDLDKDEGIKLVVDQVKDANIAETKGRHAAEQAKKQAEIYHLDLDHPSKVLNVVTTASQVSAASATISIAKPSIPAATPTVVDKGKGILIETPKPMKKKDQIKLDAEYARKLHEEINKDHEKINKDIDWDAAIDHVNQKSKNPQYIKRYQVMKKRPQTESEARKNIMIYLMNTAGYKMDFFKGMSYDEICPIFQARFDANMRFLFKSREEMKEEDQEVLKSINETPTQKAAKRRKLNEEAKEAEDLKKRLEVVNDEDDDVFTEATPLTRKLHPGHGHLDVPHVIDEFSKPDIVFVNNVRSEETRGHSSPRCKAPLAPSVNASLSVPIRNGHSLIDFRMLTPFSLPKLYSRIRCFHDANSVLSSIRGATDDQPIAEASQHPEWFQQQKKPPTPDRAWNKNLPATHESIQPWISDLAKQADSLSSFKLKNLTVEERFAFNVSLRMFKRSIVIQRRMEDLQLGVESYQKKLNITKPDTYRFDLKRKEAYTVYSNPRGFIYQNKDKQNRLMRIDELHKFSDGTLNDVRTTLDDRLKGIRIKYLPQPIWRRSDKERAAAMI
nr:hypothetical protein [Tanacetum cinerariifolium]